MAQFSVRLYATGALAEAMAEYQDQVSSALGHPVCLPYCPLTDDFIAEANAADYVRQLDEAIMTAPMGGSAVVEVVEPHYKPEGHELRLVSDWVNQVMSQFSEQMRSVQVALTVPDQLCVLLASPANTAQHKILLALSKEFDWSIRAGWDLALYQRRDGDWSVEGSWPIQQP